jgi:probable rRNA maturation factor
MSSLVIDVSREDDAWPPVDDLIEGAVGRALAVAGLAHATGAELSIVLTNDAGIRQVNGAWRGKDKATNVLSFPAVPQEEIAAAPLLGDIILARETIAAEAAEAGRRFEDHLSHLVIHGLLHVFGYDHENEADAQIMETLETRILAELGIADPYADAA